MDKNDPFGFDISVSASKKKKPRGKRGMSGAFETSTRQCEFDGCQSAALFVRVYHSRHSLLFGMLPMCICMQ